jgi:Zn/Cd-binding protein ZinT
MARMTKEERKIQQLADRKAAIKRIFSMFGRQPKAGELIKKEEAVTPYTADGLFGKGDSTLSKQYTDYVYGSYLVKHASKERIREYYRMAADPEINYALTEVADEIVQEDENKKLFMLKFDEDVKTPTREILIAEFRDLIVNRLRLGDYNAVWEWVYKWLVQGIILFKINFSDKEATGVESLEELQPWLVTKFMAEKTVEKDESKQEMEKHYYVVKDNEGAEEGYKYREEEILRFDCGYTYDGEFFSMLEFAKKDWRRLNLIEDATVIYKLSRSPLRRVFKVYVGKMAPKDIEHYLYDFRQRLREDIQYDSEKGEIIGFNPITMLDDYFFPVMEGGQEICTVDTVSEKDTKWESMDEIRYFLGKVYRAMKIPVGRMNLPNEAGEYSTATTGSRMGEIMRDEVKFANFIKRLQGRFMEQFIQELFYRHLFFRGLVDRLQLKKHQVEVRFSHVNPYSELKSAEVEEWRSNSFAALNGQNPLFSFIYLSKRYLKWTDEDLRENFKWLEKEQKLLASFGGGAGAEGAGGGGGLMGGAGAGEIPGGGGDETLTETPPEEAAETTGTEVAGGEAAPAAPAAPVAPA